MNFLSPKTISEALAFRKEYPNYKILAGGTDLCVLMNGGFIKPEGLISIWGLEELKTITEDDDSVYIGALATHSQIIHSPIIQKFVPVLAKACASIGARQIQNRGTLGGNVMNASPAGDSLPVLFAYDAEIQAFSLQGSRWIAFKDFYTGYRQTALTKEEVITQIKINKPDPREKSDFIKVGTRKAQAISKIMACCRLKIEDAMVKDCAISFGSVAAVPVRVTKTEDYLKNKKIDASLIQEAMEITKESVTPMDDIRSTAAYRKHICGVLIKRFLNEV